MLKNNGSFPDRIIICECKTELDFKGTKPTGETITISNSGKNILTTNLNINNFICLYSKGKSSCIEKKK